MTNNLNLISNIEVIVLAAGYSRRFGKKNKLLEIINNKHLLNHVIDNILEVYPYKINVIIGYDKNNIKKYIKNKLVKFIYNPKFSEGQSSSIIKGITSLNKNSFGVMICLADMPFVSSEEYLKIFSTHLKYGGDENITLPFHYKKGNPVIFGKKYFELLKNISGDIGAKKIIEKFKKKIIKVKLTSKSCFIDINTKMDFKNIK